MGFKEEQDAQMEREAEDRARRARNAEKDRREQSDAARRKCTESLRETDAMFQRAQDNRDQNARDRQREVIARRKAEKNPTHYTHDPMSGWRPYYSSYGQQDGSINEDGDRRVTRYGRDYFWVGDKTYSLGGEERTEKVIEREHQESREQMERDIRAEKDFDRKKTECREEADREWKRREANKAGQEELLQGVGRMFAEWMRKMPRYGGE